MPIDPRVKAAIASGTARRNAKPSREELRRREEEVQHLRRQAEARRANVLRCEREKIIAPWFFAKIEEAISRGQDHIDLDGDLDGDNHPISETTAEVINEIDGLHAVYECWAEKDGMDTWDLWRVRVTWS